MEENRSTSEHVLRLSGYYNRLNQVGVNLLDKIRPLVSRKARVKRTSRRMARELLRPVSKLPGRSQTMDPSPRLSAFIAREMVTRSGTAPST